MSRFLLTCVVLLTVVGLVGCGGSDRPATVKVSGKVTLDGSPVSGATVSFAPKGDAGRAATGKTDANGMYTLTTFEAGDGAVPGSYGVKITKYPTGSAEDTSIPAASEQDPGAAYEAAGEAAMTGEGVEGGGEAQNELPAKYADPNTSGFSAEVKEGETNEFNFDLTSGG